MSTKQNIVKRNGKVFVEDPLTDIVIGICFDVFNKIGAGFKEAYYEKCIELSLLEKEIKFVKQLRVPVMFNNIQITTRKLDFLLEDRLILELKVGETSKITAFHQVQEYLKIKKLKLGLIAVFTTRGVKIKRVINL
ncbi:hypothetical protein A2533_01640 [Candidatus Falkowbacteria bacterium RIFOXYD2_FULL_35_9]|uniref:GxxExxY protein n=1 Tax=Candidatus Falkowbacteria bacterium RIFOXYC2_FULL_36_12 TaxID=1798002 RepID=A0A1F5SYN3_9BACT|nr:MAG: hypothetical protein A2300_01960 [Candidatus Falkowbacteria bacterium RIFOXYB2_FULL_35_7]OGF31769.1 MAG: hypothetical protein A2478_04765 [Candidatus Falkowbacteria bacterium RIFOXYC2_FULL_36_12]OGF33103.1 MAG: hypothetical protein A2223_03405 [Candidatus Falkowbacteria bacterium RIFOXYA2_FULL_35_8]OGF48081.1 MAG: hypothetical protein A2533_01640 [Candidatus Falkowbacteria bacterium RIFOXYD2_FULL_35_9]